MSFFLNECMRTAIFQRQDSMVIYVWTAARMLRFNARLPAATCGTPQPHVYPTGITAKSTHRLVCNTQEVFRTASCGSCHEIQQITISRNSSILNLKWDLNWKINWLLNILVKQLHRNHSIHSLASVCKTQTGHWSP